LVTPNGAGAFLPPLERPNVVVASIEGRGSLPSVRLRELDAVAHVTYLVRTEAITPDEAVSLWRVADIVAVTPEVSPRISPDLVASLPRLRGIALHATGYDFVDVDALRDHGIVLSTLPEYSTRSVAEQTLGLMLSISSRLHLANDRSRGLVPPRTSLRGFELRGRTLGIVGCGRIGGTVAGLAQAIGMTTLAHDIDPKPVPGVTYVPRDELLARSDVLTLHCPLGYEAPPMFGEAELRALRRGAVLINSSRAELVDVAAVVEAVRDGHLRGYAVDDTVFSGAEVADLLAEGRILQTGHSAWWTDEVLDRGSWMWADAILAMIAGRPIDVVAGPTVGVGAATPSVRA
jgi:phosphoglycerate dehydrogenase-like enzyme